VYLYDINKEINMTMFKKLTMLLCASLFFFSQSVLASGDEGVAEKATEATKEMSQEATAAGTPTDEEKMKMKMEEGEMQSEGMKQDENKEETPAK
jgi:hypothetical protein